MWRLSQDPPCDLLTVHYHEGMQQPRHILLPVRGGLHADLAAELAVALARDWGGSVTILRVIPEYVPEDEAAIESDAFRALWEGRYPDVVQVKSVVAGSVRDCILQEGAAHDLLVMGATATSRSYPYPFGKLGEEIAERASCPVLIAKTERRMAVDEIGVPPGGLPLVAGGERARDVSTIVDKWFAENTFHSKEFAAIGELVRLKEQQGSTISLVLPTLNEEETIGSIIECMQEELQRRYPLIDEMIVIDSRSQDRTATIAARHDVSVYVHQDLMPEVGSYHGKGEALWKSLSVTRGDIVAWIDTDIANIHPKFVYGILGPLLREPRIGYVKGFYRRPLRQGDVMHEASGGRVTELMARPLINMFYPLLSGVIQPLSGEYAGRRSVLEQVPFQTGYGVEIALLIDILDRFGLNAIAQVDLEKRIHRNQSLAALSRMSFAILQTVLRRLERQQQIELVTEVGRTMKVIEQMRGGFHLDVRYVEDHERSPIAEVLLTAAGV
jgi:glucosyl-3-phosphoglycerate synthase